MNKLSSTFTKLIVPALMAAGCEPQVSAFKETDASIAQEDAKQQSSSPDAKGNCPPQPPLVAEYQVLVRDQLNQCTGCHSETGVAKGTWKGFDSKTNKLSNLQGDFDSFLDVAVKETADGSPHIVAYPMGTEVIKYPDGTPRKHGGGVQSLTPDQIAALTQFHLHATQVSQGQNPSLKAVADCSEQSGQLTEQEFFEGVNMLDYRGIAVKFLRDVTGGPLHVDLPPIQNNEELKNQLREISYQRGFYDWLKWRLNDVTQTRFYRNNSDAQDLMGTRYGAMWKMFNNAEVADGPGNLLAFIVRDGRPVTDLIRAQYYVAPGVKPPGEDPNENWVARLQGLSVDPAHPEPLSGLITDPLVLGQVTTTDTNIGRKRAEWTLRNFAHTRVLDTASRIVQAPPNMDLPTLTYPACAQCHTATPLDSVAASFWDYQGEDGYKHSNKLPAPFLSITYGGESVPKDSPDRLGNMMWLISKDVKFARSMADLAFNMLMNRSPMAHPKPGEMAYEEHMRHFQVEDAFLDNMGKYLMDHGYNFRELILEMASSRWFAANGRMTSKPSSSRKEELKGVGPNMAPPEVLALRLRQMFADEVFPTKVSSLVTNTFVRELGGFDSINVRNRGTSPNAPNELVRDYLAYEVDKLVVRELSRPPQQRYLLKDLDFTILEAPVYPVDNTPIAGNEAKYRNALVNIQRLALGKNFDPNAPEITAEYNKWIALWKLTLQDLGSGKIASTHRADGMSPDDPQGLVRTWGAYVATVVQGLEFGLY